MKKINKLITVLALLVIVPRSVAQQSQGSVVEVVDRIHLSVEEINTSNDQIYVASRSAVLKYIYGRPVQTTNFLSYVKEVLGSIQEYSDQVISDAYLTEELTNNAFDLSTVKKLSSNIQVSTNVLDHNLTILAQAIERNIFNEVFSAYRLLCNDLRHIAHLSEEITANISAINTDIYATYDVRIRFVDAEGNELPSDRIAASYVATNLATQNIFFSTEDENIEDSGYNENAIFRGLQNGIYTFEGYGGIEISDREFFIEKSLVNEEGYIEVIILYTKPVEKKFDVKIQLEDANGNEVPPFVLPGYKVIDLATGAIVYDNKNEIGTVVGFVSGLPQGTYDFIAYSGLTDGANSRIVELSDALVNEEGFIVVVLKYRSN